MTEVVAALIWDKDKFLICQRPANKARALLWEFVGGKVEAGETKEQALIRECKEELNITLNVGDVFMEVVHEYPDITVHLTLFNATIAEGVPQKLEHNDIKWIKPNDIPDYEFCPADEEILEKIKDSQIIKYHTITKRWGNKEFCRNFSLVLDRWLNQFTEDEKPLMLYLLKNFYFYSNERLGSKMMQLYEKLKETFPNIYKEISYIGIEKDFNVGFSMLAFDTFWSKNGLYEKCIKDFKYFLECEQVLEHLAIVDDYSGTGSTFIKYVNKLITINPKIRNSKIYFLTIHISKDAIENIKSFAVAEGIDIYCVSLDVSSRAFEEDYIYDAINAKIAKEKYEKMCECRKLALDKWFGYKEIAALVAFEYNTPNNTLGLFWSELDDFFSLFVRKKKARTKLDGLKEKAKQNKNFRKSKILIQNIEDTRLNMFMVYCVAWKKQLSITKACYDFGFTDKQFRDVITYLIEKEYLEFEEGKIIASDKMRKYIFSSRFKGFKELYYKLEKENKIANVQEDNYIPINFKIN